MVQAVTLKHLMNQGSGLLLLEMQEAWIGSCAVNMTGEIDFRGKNLNANIGTTAVYSVKAYVLHASDPRGFVCSTRPASEQDDSRTILNVDAGLFVSGDSVVVFGLLLIAVKSFATKFVRFVGVLVFEPYSMKPGNFVEPGQVSIEPIFVYIVDPMTSHG